MREAIQLLNALSDETRLRLVKVLLDDEWCVCELADALEVEQSNLSRHIAVLRNAGLVSDRKEGTWVYYTIAKEARRRLRRVLQSLGNIETQRTQLDARRLKQRLLMRNGGVCCFGYGQLCRDSKRR